MLDMQLFEKVSRGQWILLQVSVITQQNSAESHSTVVDSWFVTRQQAINTS